MKRIAAAAILLPILFSAPARAADPSPGDWTGLFAQASLLSDYRYYGFSESNRKPTYWLNLHAVLPDGFYLGAVAIGVKFNDRGNTQHELDYYGGKHIVWDNNDLNLAFLVDTFPDQHTGTPSYGFFQTSAEFAHHFDALTLSAKEAWSPNYSSGTGTAWITSVKAAYDFTEWLSADGETGDLTIERGPERHYWSVGATAKWKFVTLGLHYEGNDLTTPQCYYTNWCKSAWVASLSVGAPVASFPF
jgi:uncharacterized protein (TIGR02001 family)